MVRAAKFALTNRRERMPTESLTPKAPPSVTGEHSALKYRRDIDGLRAIAVSSVVLYHIFPNAVPGGFIGVDVFFLISGFLISGIIWDALSAGKFTFTEFYGRRIRRIFPALALVLGATLAGGYFSLYWEDLARLGKHVLGGAFFASNFLLLNEGGYFDIAAEKKPLLHLWSLSIEEQFYLVWPLVLIAIWRLRLNFVLAASILGLASFVANVYLTAQGTPYAFFNPLTRSWELLLGATVGHLVRTRGPLHGRLSHFASVIGLVLIGLGLALLNRTSPFPGYAALLPAVGTALLLSVAPTAVINRWLLSSSVCVAIGLISYPLYLWHWPLFSITFVRLNGLIPLGTALQILAASVVLAWLTYVCVERPIRTRHQTGFMAVLLAALVFGLGGLGYAAWKTNGFIKYTEIPSNAEYLTKARTFDDWLREVREGKCFLKSTTVLSFDKECFESTKPSVVLWGDSFGASLYTGLRELQKTSGFGLTQLTASACAPIPRVSSMRTNCDEINSTTLEKLKELSPESLILSAAWVIASYRMPSDQILSRLREQLGVLRREIPRTKIILVGPFPKWGESMQKILTQLSQQGVHPLPRYLPLPDLEDNRQAREIEPLMRQLAAEFGVSYVSPTEILCDQGQCLTRVDDTVEGLVIVDFESHMNPKASFLIASKISQLL
jgi:peptidoglycan/LPS O-acetylase OafA/YrhL